MYDKKWEKYSPGKVSQTRYCTDFLWFLNVFRINQLSALREMALAREMKQAGLDSMHSLYMGW